jgi:hypothetical protein
MTSTFWNEERVAILKRGRAENWPASRIAALLGCSRNAVLGKAGRLGLPPVIHPGGRPVATEAGLRRAGAASAAQPGTTRRPRLALASGQSHVMRVQPARLLAELAHLAATEGEPPSRQIAFADLKAGECRWISGDDGCCCGHATVLISARGRHMASPYCGFHSARAYRAPRENSKSAAPDPRHSASKTRVDALAASLPSAARRA